MVSWRRRDDEDDCEAGNLKSSEVALMVSSWARDMRIKEQEGRRGGGETYNFGEARHGGDKCRRRISRPVQTIQC